MYQGKSTRRDFLIGAGTGLVAIAQAANPSSLFALSISSTPSAQAQPINGFQNLKEYSVKLFDETKSYNYFRDEKGNSIPSLDREMKFPYVFEGDMLGRRTEVYVHKDLPNGPYSLETKTYFNRVDVPFGGNPDLNDLAEVFLYPHFASNVFLDKGIKGNLQGRADALTAVSMSPQAVEYSMFTGDGGYQFAHFIFPVKPYVSESQMDEEIRKRIGPIFDGLTRLKFSERELNHIVGIFTSFDGLNNGYGHSPDVMALLLDGIAWHSPSGALQTYWDLSLGNRTRESVGTQPRALGSYSGTSHSEFRRRREQAITNGDRQNRQILQMTIDNLVAEGKISLQ